MIDSQLSDFEKIKKEYHWRMDNAMQLFGQLLKSEREKAGVTQQEIADATGRTASHISYIERGRYIPNKKILKAYIKLCDSKT